VQSVVAKNGGSTGMYASPIPDYENGVPSSAADESLATAAGVQVSDTSSILSQSRGIISLNDVAAKVVGMIAQLSRVRDESTFSVTDAIGVIQNIMELPGLISGALVSRVNAIKGIGISYLNYFANGNMNSLKNTVSALINEVFITATISAIAREISNATPETRSESVAIIRAFAEYSSEVSTVTDVANAQTAGLNIESQYFGGVATQEAIFDITALIERYLLLLMYNLKVERTIVLERDRYPMEIAITEYGLNGWKDDYFFLFLRTNKLIGREIMLLPAGREVKIYA